MTHPSDSPATDTIVLIHGLWVTSLSWEHWIDRYVDRGYRVIAKGWPGMDVPIEEIRKDPSFLADLGVAEIVNHFDAIVRELGRPPILMGHSFGGLIVQILLDRGLGAAGVAIDPAPVKGIVKLPLSTLRVSFPALRNPANLHKVSGLTADQFHYAFTNTLSEEEAREVYERYEVPGPNRVLFQAGLANVTPHATTTVNFRNDTRAPLLLIAGGKDHISPAALTRANFELYQKSRAMTALKEFPERSHFTIGERGWEAVADYALDWSVQNAAGYLASGRASSRGTPRLDPAPRADTELRA
ncbi:MAG TPA: alpha/beta fold hydrolase [Gemmatimonadaceae bacterium]|nr:alpha/beta fold hydrolase [Gemmatimonadaceae bacterium]